MRGHYDFLLVGAGLFNGVVSRLLTGRGLKVLVAEKRPHIGGNLYMDRIEGIDIHTYGPHIFHTSDSEVWDFVTALTDFNDFINSPIADYHGERYHLPFNMYTFREMWGVSDPEEAKAIIASQREEAGIRGEPRNLEEQALSLVGRDIYQKLIKGYTEKQWGRDCTLLPPSIIRRLPVRFTYDNNYYNDTYQGIPLRGYNELIGRLFEGADIMTGCDFLKHRDSLRKLSDRVVYTGPIDEYFGRSLGALSYRTLRFENELLDTPDFQGTAVINYTDRETPYTRVIEHRHFTGISPGRTVITREYPAEYTPGAEPYYPVGDADNLALYERYRLLADDEEDVYFGGRLGSYRYLDMDKTVREALDLARGL